MATKNIKSEFFLDLLLIIRKKYFYDELLVIPVLQKFGENTMLKVKKKKYIFKEEKNITAKLKISFNCYRECFANHHTLHKPISYSADYGLQIFQMVSYK